MAGQCPARAPVAGCPGGRGTGKSGVLLLTRFALGAPIPEEYADEVDEYVRCTLGTGHAAVSVSTRHGVRYTSTRAYGGEPVVRDERGEVVNVSLSGALFAIEAYAQNEIEGIARDAKAQLALIDRFLGGEAERIDAAVADLDRRIVASAARRRRLEGESADDDAREAELATVAEALKGMDLGGDAAPARSASAPTRPRCSEAASARRHGARPPYRGTT